jgi:hypothetical protein
MNSKLRILGLALVAALAFSAMAASATSAKTAIVVPSPVALHGEDNPEGKTELTGIAGVKCNVVTYEGNANESTITLEPTFEGCLTSTNAPVTVTVNGCAYKLTLGALTSMTAPAKEVQLECPEKKSIEVHLYGNQNHTIPACTINIGPQTPSSSITVEDRTDNTFRTVGSATSITSTLAGHCLTTPPFNLAHDGPIPSPLASTLHVDIGPGVGGGGGPLGLQTQK